MNPEMLAQLLGGILPMVLIFVVMYMILIMPQRKKEKKLRNMISALKVGDEVVSIGGVVGKVINLKDDEVTVETSVMKTKVQFKKWAIKEVTQVIEA